MPVTADSTLRTADETCWTADGYDACGLIPENESPPVLSGNAWVGQTLSLSLGEWPISAVSFTRQWYRDGVAIAGETNATYDTVLADAFSTIYGEVIAYSSLGDPSDPAQSNSLVIGLSPLPGQYPLVGTLSVMVEPNVAEFKPDVGAPLRRKRFTESRLLYRGNLKLTSAEVESLMDFFNDYCQAGAASFEMPDWVTGEVVEFRWETPPTVSHIAADFWIVSISLARSTET